MFTYYFDWKILNKIEVFYIITKNYEKYIIIKLPNLTCKIVQI